VAKIICGVDVSSETLDASIGADGPHVQVSRDGEGVNALARFCREHKASLVVMEASGGYEQLVFALLWKKKVACAIVNARAVRWFAESMGKLEKTDRIDAGMIAEYAAAKRIVAQQPAGETQQRLGALVTRLRQLTALKVAQLNQRRLIGEAAVLASIDAVIALLRSQIRQFEHQIGELLAADPLWCSLATAFRSIKGVAGRTVAGLMAELPEIGTLSNKAAAKLVGLAPIANDSGAVRRRRTVRGGRTGLRSTLFVVAGVVRRHDPDFADFHKRLTAAGKPKMVVRIALARKLLVRLNAKARDARRKLQLAA
jgi:transposase